jgi:hypothetical protein
MFHLTGRTGYSKAMDRGNRNLKAIGSSLPQSGSRSPGARVRSRPESMAHASAGGGGHMMSEATPPLFVFSLHLHGGCPARRAIETGEGPCCCSFGSTETLM